LRLVWAREWAAPSTVGLGLAREAGSAHGSALQWEAGSGIEWVQPLGGARVAQLVPAAAPQRVEGSGLAWGFPWAKGKGVGWESWKGLGRVARLGASRVRGKGAGKGWLWAPATATKKAVGLGAATV
jgi:hypothetical protein